MVYYMNNCCQNENDVIDFSVWLLFHFFCPFRNRPEGRNCNEDETSQKFKSWTAASNKFYFTFFFSLGQAHVCCACAWDHPQRSQRWEFESWFLYFLFSFFSAHIHVIISVMKSTGLKRSFLGTEQRGKPSLLLDWATVEPIGTLKEVVTNPNKLRPFVCQRWSFSQVVFKPPPATWAVVSRRQHLLQSTHISIKRTLIGFELVSFGLQCCQNSILCESTKMADVSQHQLLLSECYRGSSPRSASTPGPAAPDSPANSASGRFSASPSVAAALLSPSISGANCFSSNYHYSPYHHHHHGMSQHPAALGLMGSFLSVGSYPYAALAAAAAAAAAGMAGHLAPPLAPPPLLHPLSRIRQSSPTSQSVSRVLPFSVENILKPEFGRNQPTTESTPTETGDNQESGQVEVKPLNREAIKRTASVAAITSPSLGNKRVKSSSTSVSPPLTNKKTPPVSIKADPADLSGRTSSCTDSSSFSSGEGSSNGKDGEQSTGSTELPTDPTKMTDPAKWPAWIFCTRYSDRPSSGKFLSVYVFLFFFFWI